MGSARRPFPLDVWLRSRRVLLEGQLRPAALALRQGRVARIAGHDEQAPPKTEGVDVGDHVVMAGLIDTHVHVNEPGRTEWEGYESATRAAALGGVTTICDMPLNSMPVTTTLDALLAKQRATEGKLWIDVGFWGGVVPGNDAELSPMVRAGVRGFKCFLCPSGIDEFPPVGRRELLRAMPILRDLGVPLLVHAELELPLRTLPGPAPDQRAYATYLHQRPPEWEDAAVALMVELVRETGCRAHIVHLSSAGALPLLRAAKAEGLPITAETCPHYLCLAAEGIPDGATAYKCAPPIREGKNRDALWAALVENVIDFVVTDHSPCIPGLKRLDEGDFLGAWGGIASLQLGLSAVWSEAQGRGIPLATLHGWMSKGPARFLGIPRGTIATGARADLVAFDPEAAFRVDPAQLAHKNPLTPYAGHTLTGRVRHVWLGGEAIVRDAAMQGGPLGTWL